jgi:hypothetical protein
MEADADRKLMTLKGDVVSLEDGSPVMSASQMADKRESASAVEGSGFGRVVEAMVCGDGIGRPCGGSPHATKGNSSDDGESLFLHPGMSQGFKISVKSSSRSSYDSKCSGGGGDLPDSALWSEGLRKIGSARRQCVLARGGLVGSEGRR